jgi:hypothetical protein
MMTNENILDTYKLAANGAKGHPQSLPSPAFVFNISSHRFIFTEVESNGRSFLLKLAEAFPGDPPIIQLQTEAQISKQVREFCENRDAA